MPTRLAAAEPRCETCCGAASASAGAPAASTAPHAGQNRPVSSVVVEHAMQTCMFGVQRTSDLRRVTVPAMQCPQCRGEAEPRPVGFTWWGGLIGPRLFNHVECPRCGARFNGRTGQSNTTAIAIYMVVLGALTLGLVLALTSR